MDIFLLVMGLAALAWIGMLIWVQHNVKGMPEEIRRANADVLLLPVLGFVMYLGKRQRRLRELEAPKTLTGKVAALAPGEVPKKRGLFGGRTRIAAALASQKAPSGHGVPGRGGQRNQGP